MHEFKIQLDEITALFYIKLSELIEKHPEDFISEVLRRDAEELLKFADENKRIDFKRLIDDL